MAARTACLLAAEILCDVLPCNEPSVANSAVSPTDGTMNRKPAVSALCKSSAELTGSHHAFPSCQGQPKACEESNTARRWEAVVSSHSSFPRHLSLWTAAGEIPDSSAPWPITLLKHADGDMLPAPKLTIPRFALHSALMAMFRGFQVLVRVLRWPAQPRFWTHRPLCVTCRC